MLTVRHTEPKIAAEAQHGWQIMFWLGDAFDYSTPFRAVVAEIVSILEETAPVRLSLPAYVPDEDFVEGSLRFGTASVGVYYEYSLGYLALMSRNRSVLEEIAAKVLPRVQVA